MHFLPALGLKRHLVRPLILTIGAPSTHCPEKVNSCRRGDVRCRPGQPETVIAALPAGPAPLAQHSVTLTDAEHSGPALRQIAQEGAEHAAAQGQGTIILPRKANVAIFRNCVKSGACSARGTKPPMSQLAVSWAVANPARVRVRSRTTICT